MSSRIWSQGDYWRVYTRGMPHRFLEDVDPAHNERLQEIDERLLLFYSPRRQVYMLANSCRPHEAFCRPGGERLNGWRVFAEFGSSAGYSFANVHRTVLRRDTRRMGRTREERLLNAEMKFGLSADAQRAKADAELDEAVTEAAGSMQDRIDTSIAGRSSVVVPSTKKAG